MGDSSVKEFTSMLEQVIVNQKELNDKITVSNLMTMFQMGIITKEDLLNNQLFAQEVAKAKGPDENKMPSNIL